jgi:hypothetical protein
MRARTGSAYCVGALTGAYIFKWCRNPIPLDSSVPLIESLKNRRRCDNNLTHVQLVLLFKDSSCLLIKADVAELADALDSKSSTGNSVWVRSPPSAEALPQISCLSASLVHISSYECQTRLAPNWAYRHGSIERTALPIPTLMKMKSFTVDFQGILMMRI